MIQLILVFGYYLDWYNYKFNIIKLKHIYIDVEVIIARCK